MHAGYWLNHTVHAPYPVKLDTIIKKMVREYQADKYCLVNGQQFYQDWAENYFGEEGAGFIAKNEYFYHDYILLPIYLYVDLLTFETSLHEMSRLKKMFEESGNKSYFEKIKPVLEKARMELDIINKRNIEGDKNKKWEGWYDPAKRRPNNGFPTQEKLDAIDAALNT